MDGTVDVVLQRELSGLVVAEVRGMKEASEQIFEDMLNTPSP